MMIQGADGVFSKLTDTEAEEFAEASGLDTDDDWEVWESVTEEGEDELNALAELIAHAHGLSDEAEMYLANALMCGFDAETALEGAVLIDEGGHVEGWDDGDVDVDDCDPDEVED